MHSIESTQVLQNTYNTKDARLAESEVEKILCVLSPASALIASMGGRGECISARYSISKGGVEWENTLFDQAVGNEIMLRQRHANKYVFTNASRQLIVPDAVHQQEHSKQLLRDIYHLQPDDHIGLSACKADKAHLIFASENAVHELTERHIGATTILPLNLFQYLKTEKQSGYHVNCLLTEQECFLTIREQGRLIWHHALSYGGADDVVFHLLHACREFGIPSEKLRLECTATFPEATVIIDHLRNYFVDVYAGVTTDGDWAPVVYLLKQLDSCVS